MQNPNTKEEPTHEVRTADAKMPRDKISLTEVPRGAAEYRETLLLLAKMMATIFVCEAAIMTLLAALPLSRRWSILADPVLLTILGAPILYWLLVRPIQRALQERKKAEQRLLVYQKQLKSLASQLSLTEERERHRLATELHDRIGQSLILCKMKLDQLRIHDPPGEHAETVQEICDDLREIIQRARNLIFDLSSPVLYDLGLEAALDGWLAEEIQRKHGIKTVFEDDGRQKPLTDDIRATLFNGVKELLFNVVRHARAQKAKVSVRISGQNIHVSVEDDGVGFDPDEVTARAAGKAEFGLFNIRERLEQLGGVFKIDSQPGRGTRISMTAPLDQAKARSGP
jgi:signal transduction histidine kinase